jgi:hypothetical protein
MSPGRKVLQRRALFGALGAVAVLLVLVGAFRAATSLDGVRGAFFSILFADTTVYAPNYTDLGYRSIRIGETEESVLRILGEPTEHDSPDGYVARWRYTKSKSDSHYRMRQISFKNGRVVSKEHYFLVD